MNYPNGLKKTYKANTSKANRGMSLESDINSTNEYYLSNDIAVIYKKPTPITIAKVDYPSKVEAIVKKAYFKTPSTTDYNGIYKAKYIDFEAKETKSPSFPLSNIHNHQIEHLRKIVNHGGIGFLLVRFTRQNETYLLDCKDLFEYLENSNKKSIPNSYFKEKAHLIKDTYNPRIDYLKVIDILYFGGIK